MEKKPVLNMKEKALVGFVISFAVVLTASLILASGTHDVQLVTNPSGLDIHAQAGEPFNITCKGEGGDDRKYAFMKWLTSDGNAIAEGIPGVVKKEKNTLLLTFTNPKIEDSGIYRCTVLYGNEHNLEYIVNIHFQDPKPEFLVAFENVTAEEGKRLEVNCSAEGLEPIFYYWYNQKEDIISENESMPIFVSKSAKFSTLIIRKVKKDDEGLYTCTGKNGHGLGSKVYALHVLPSSGNDTDNDTSDFDIKVVNISVNSVQFYIPTKGSVRNIEVKYAERQNATETYTLLTPVSNSIYTISGLVPSGLYSFQFRTSEKWSEVYRVTLLPDVPELIFQNVESSSVKIEWFRKMEDNLRATIDKYELRYYTVRMEGGNKWISSSCAATIQLPSCFGSKYTIAGLYQNTYYQIEVRAHTVSGYGEPVRQKIYFPR